VNANQTGVWHSADFTELNLTGTAQATSTPTPTRTLTPTPTGPTPTNTPTPTTASTHTPTATSTATSAVTNTPTATVIPTIVHFRRGVGGYDGNVDVHLDLSNPSTNYGDSLVMYAKTQDNVTVLTRFDVSSLPADVMIVEATLRLFVQTTVPANTPVTFHTYRVMRSWNEAEATWGLAQTGTSWSMAGVNGIGMDRSGVADDQLACYDPTEDPLDHWVELDVTESVQHWVDHPSENYGVVVKAYTCNDQTVYYAFPSSEASGVDARPQLVVSYAVAPPTATPTNTGPPTNTPTATGTPTRTVSPTATGTATPTATSTTGGVQGLVWHDINRNGQADLGEPPLPNAVLNLYREGNLVDSYTTLVDGFYRFENMAPGNYALVENDPPGYVSTTSNNRAFPILAGQSQIINFGDRLADTPTPTITPTPTLPRRAALPVLMKRW